MNRLLSIVGAALMALPVVALPVVALPTSAAAEDEAFPLTGAFTVLSRTRHSLFAGTEGDANFGAVEARISGNLFYTPRAIPDLTFSGGFFITKAAYESSERAFFQFQTEPGLTQMSDLNFGANWNFARLGPVLLTLGLNNSIAFSNFSRALGITFSTGPSISATYRAPGGIILGLNGSLGVNFLANATAQVNERAVENIRVSGRDVGQANQAGTTGLSASINYQPLPGLFLGGVYFIDNWISAVVGPDDEFTARNLDPELPSQTGLQSALLNHGTSFSIRYQFKQLGGGAAEVFNEAAGAEDKEDSWVNHVAFGLSMLTWRPLYLADGSGISNPFFDNTPYLHPRTLYSVFITGMM